MRKNEAVKMMPQKESRKKYAAKKEAAKRQVQKEAARNELRDVILSSTNQGAGIGHVTQKEYKRR